LSYCLSAYLLDFEELAAALGGGSESPELLERICLYADEQQELFESEDFAEDVKRVASLLLDGRFAEAAEEPLLLDAFEAICFSLGEPQSVGPFAECRVELYEECGNAGEFLLERGCPIEKVAEVSPYYAGMGYIKNSEMETLLVEVSSRIDDAPDCVETALMEAWETLEEILSKANDRRLDLITFLK